MKQSSMKHQQGFLTLVSIALIVIVGFIGVAFAYMMFGSAFSTINLQESTSALFIAESGLEDAAHSLLFPTLTNRNACLALSLTNPIGDGTYSTTSTGPFFTSSPTTLNGALTAAATSIPVVSTTNYQSSGRIMIDQELINYAATDATHFLFAQRGVDGSTAASHATGAPIGQYQCNIISQGGAPSLTLGSGAPGGKRVLNENIQLQEAWAVGNVASAKYSLVRWNRPTEIKWTDSSTAISGSNALNGIYMLSNVDGWAVGAAGAFIHWNGNAWALTTVAPNVAYQSVFCAASNLCFAVGANSGGANIQYWNGTTWTHITNATTPNLVNPSNNNLNSVHCDSSVDCWAVGTNTGNKFYNYNGTSWTGVNVVTAPNSVATGSFTFNSVFCNSSTDCWAVGADASFARKNGANWTAFATGLPAVTYMSVMCISSNDCWTVGNTTAVAPAGVVIAHWNGTAWTRYTSSLPTPAINLTEVNCFTTSDCWAIGAVSGGVPQFLHYDGTTWANVTATNGSGTPNAQLNSLSLIGPTTQPWSAWSEDFG